jgi:hypothetical protein
MNFNNVNHSPNCAGEKFGHFTVIRRAGSMGQSSTWWCLDSRTGTEVIKSRQELRRVRLKEERCANRDNPRPITTEAST